MWYWPLGRHNDLDRWSDATEDGSFFLSMPNIHTHTHTSGMHVILSEWTVTCLYIYLLSLSLTVFSLYIFFYLFILLAFLSFSFFLYLSLWPEAHSVVWRAIDFSSLSFSRWDFDRIMALWKQRKLLFDNRGGGRAESFIYVVANAGGEATIEFIITVSQLKVQPCRTKSHYNRLGWSEHFISQKMTGKWTGSNLT